MAFSYDYFKTLKVTRQDLQGFRYFFLVFQKGYGGGF